MKKRKFIQFFIAFFALFLVFCAYTTTAQAKKMKVTVSPSSLDAQAKKHHTVYDKSVAHSMSLNETLEKMRKKGGGTLTLKKGTYRFQYSVCIPSNVTVKLKKGVVLQNIMDYKAHIAPTTLMFQFVAKDKTYKKKIIGKYNGTSKAKLIGEGNVIIDMKYVTGLAVNVLHCSNIEISGITFKGMNKNHYIEVNASKNVNIHECKFVKAKKGSAKSAYVKEAINIDLPDAASHGIGSTWAKQDKTPCKNVTVKNCVFDSMSRGVGSHNYSQTSGGFNIYHTNIRIEGNTFKNLYDAGVYMMNWKDTKIVNNTFINNGKGNNLTFTNTGHAISGSGIEKITISGNTFQKIKKNPVNFNGQSNQGNGAKYKKIYVNITEDEANAMLDNTSIDCGNDPAFPGYDIVYFRGDGSRLASNAVGICFEKQEVNFEMEKAK